MKYLRKLGLLLLVMGVVLLWSFGATTGKVMLRYADGKTVAISATIRPNADIPIADKGPVLTMDVYGWIELESTGPVRVIHPGQRVTVWCSFNPLNTLEVPFEQLVGHNMYISTKLTGAVTFSNLIGPLQIISGGVWSGFGGSFDVPSNAPPGQFIQTARVAIEGFSCQKSISMNRNLVAR